jgi:hypothetical protein
VLLRGVYAPVRRKQVAVISSIGEIVDAYVPQCEVDEKRPHSVTILVVFDENQC